MEVEEYAVVSEPKHFDTMVTVMVMVTMETTIKETSNIHPKIITEAEEERRG